MDATALLAEDHDRLRQLLAEAATAGTPGERRTLFHSLRGVLSVHSRLEEDVFYPALKKLRSEETSRIVRESLEAHHVADGLLAELNGLEPDDPRFVARLKALADALLQHIRDEEDRTFREARLNLTDQRLASLGAAMEELREKLRGAAP